MERDALTDFLKPAERDAGPLHERRVAVLALLQKIVARAAVVHPHYVVRGQPLRKRQRIDLGKEGRHHRQGQGFFALEAIYCPVKAVVRVKKVITHQIRGYLRNLVRQNWCMPHRQRLPAERANAEVGVGEDADGQARAFEFAGGRVVAKQRRARCFYDDHQRVRVQMIGMPMAQYDAVELREAARVHALVDETALARMEEQSRAIEGQKT